MEKARGTPLLIDGSNAMTALERVQLGSGHHSEEWLQAVIHDQPQILPIAQIEPGMGAIIPVAREVPCGHGYIDNLFVTGMTYEQFEQAAAKAPSGPASLYGCVAGLPDALSEAEFVDAISANLARGRMLVLVVGDGIRREAEALSDLLQSHAGAHFTFALVELATWREVDMALRYCPPLPRSTRSSIRSLSMSRTLSIETSATRSPAPYATDSAA